MVLLTTSSTRVEARPPSVRLVQACQQVPRHSLTVVAGRNDKRTKRGKIYAGTNGKSRPRVKNSDDPVDPYFTLREWGKKQDPPMSVEEVVAMKVADLKKVEVTNADILDAVTPF